MISLDAGKTLSISQYVKVKNFADVTDLVDITAEEYRTQNMREDN